MKGINLQPFTKILKSEYTLNDEDLVKYSVPFNYIDVHTKEFNELLPQTATVDEETKQLHKRLIAVKERINKANTEYTKLNSAISRLQNNLDSMDSIIKETEDTWKNLSKVEEQLPKNSLKYT